METPPSITPHDVRRWAEMVASRLERNGVTSIPVDRDLCFMISFQEAFDLSQEPKLLTGSVHEAVKDLNNEAAEQSGDPELILPVWHPCHHLAEVMSFIAFQELGPEGAV
ncbi:MAG: hypothetical protein ACRC7G_04500 [Beijerinckiaceae bacterium]